ncbi:MAG: type I methionyl aminopeptidase [Clostridia bacterium]|nr:type I methionyl aminopeptidase [Clostridia bacterium]
MIVIKSESQIEMMREAGKVVKLIFEELNSLIKPGISTKDIDDLVEKICKEKNVIAAEKGYSGYPASICTSVNDEVVHGIPSPKRILREGDIVSCDVVVDYKGYMADACRTFAVGKISDEAKRLNETAEKAFFEGIKFAKPGYRLRDIQRAIQETVEAEGFSVIRDFTGHGIGSKMHEDPMIPNYVTKSENPRLKPGMTLAIEPMITAGDYEIDILLDDWTAVTVDGSLASHYENTIVITNDEPEIITL